MPTTVQTVHSVKTDYKAAALFNLKEGHSLFPAKLNLFPWEAWKPHEGIQGEIWFKTNIMKKNSLKR